MAAPRETYWFQTHDDGAILLPPICLLTVGAKPNDWVEVRIRRLTPAEFGLGKAFYLKCPPGFQRRAFFQRLLNAWLALKGEP